MGYRSPYMRFGNTRYEKNIARLRRYDLHLREKTYKEALNTLDEVYELPDPSDTYIDHVVQYVNHCGDQLRLGPVTDDDAMLVARHGLDVLGRDEYDWMKLELAQKGEKVEEMTWSTK